MAVYTAESYKINRLILWDTVFEGKSYIESLQVMHDNMLRDENRFNIKYMSSAGSTTELIGYDFSQALRDEICSIDLRNIEKIKTRKIDVFCYQGGEGVDSIIQDDNFLARATVHKFDSDAEWNNVDKIESRVLVAPAVDKIIEVIG